MVRFNQYPIKCIKSSEPKIPTSLEIWVILGNINDKEEYQKHNCISYFLYPLFSFLFHFLSPFSFCISLLFFIFSHFFFSFLISFFIFRGSTWHLCLLYLFSHEVKYAYVYFGNQCSLMTLLLCYVYLAACPFGYLCLSVSVPFCTCLELSYRLPEWSPVYVYIFLSCGINTLIMDMSLCIPILLI